jgi:hypothetical protein
VTPVECTCDAGYADGGICPDCGGIGWLFELDTEDQRRIVALGN